MIRLTEQIYGFENDLMIGSCGFCYSVIQCIITKEAKRGHNRKERPIAVLFCFTLYLYWEKGIISRVKRPVGSIEPS